MHSGLTLVLTRSDVEALLSPDDCRTAVEEAFRAFGNGEAAPPAIVGVRGVDGGFHIKAGLWRRGRCFFAAKVNGNFAGNVARGLARIQGVVVLSEGDTGEPLALMDSASITTLRTAAATAVAAQQLARQDASIVTICGCGIQGRAQLIALSHARMISKVFAFDVNHECAEDFAREMKDALAINTLAVDDLRTASRASDIVVTCTSSNTPLLFDGDLSPGAFVAAVGADSETKQELDSTLLSTVTLVTDVTAQCATIGDLHHAIAAGTMSLDLVHAELGEIVAGRKRGRSSEDEVIVFDSTGMALQDVAAAAAVYEAAVRTGRGTVVTLSG
jgi:ornithine cyclodeaminase/alanine dehydrogenase-like protein (mu-crystallin family)